MTCIHRLKHIDCFFPADFSHDDPVRPHTKSIDDELADANGSLALDVGRARFQARCARTGVLTLQHTRKWLLSKHMTQSEIVQTAFKCALTSVEHEAREQFTYRGKPIFGPNLNVDQLVDLCAAESLDVRA